MKRKGENKGCGCLGGRECGGVWEVEACLYILGGWSNVVWGALVVVCGGLMAARGGFCGGLGWFGGGLGCFGCFWGVSMDRQTSRFPILARPDDTSSR